MTLLVPGHAYTLNEVLPHGPSMQLLDRLVDYGRDSLSCEVVIRPDSPFAEPRGVPGWVGIEYMAQALGAYTGIARLQGGQAVQIELLLGTRSYDCQRPYFAPGARLTVQVRLLYWDPEGVCAFACEIKEEDRVVASCELKGYEPHDIEPFLRKLHAGDS